MMKLTTMMMIPTDDDNENGDDVMSWRFHMLLHLAKTYKKPLLLITLFELKILQQWSYCTNTCTLWKVMGCTADGAIDPWSCFFILAQWISKGGLTKILIWSFLHPIEILNIYPFFNFVLKLNFRLILFYFQIF